MRIVVPYTSAYHPLARATHEAFGVDRVDVSANPNAYWGLLATLWGEGRSLLLVEHDIELRARAVQRALHCQCSWSVNPYRGPGRDLLRGSLGCTRFGAALMEAEPDLLGAVGRVDDSLEHGICDWRRLDVRLFSVLRGRGYEPHVHEPQVIQHHVYDGRCSCGADHPAFPVDQLGRYRPPEG